MGVNCQCPKSPPKRHAIQLSMSRFSRSHYGQTSCNASNSFKWSLEQLRLQDVYLRQSEGMWETSILWVGQSFRLKSICLEHLEDHLPCGGDRVLFIRDSSICHDDSWLLPGTRQYESQLHACALGKLQILPSPPKRFGYYRSPLPF